jgi:hypothetical protein
MEMAMRLSLSLLVVGALLCCTQWAHAQSASDSMAVLCPTRGALAPLVEAAAAKHHVPAVVLVAMMRVESTCDPRAINRRTGSVGLLQIKLDGSANPDEMSPDELSDPAVNLDLGARHLRRWTLVCGSLTGGLGIFHGRVRCAHGKTDGYARKVLELVAWAKRTIEKLQRVRS